MHRLTVIDTTECHRLLVARHLGRVGVVHDGMPYVVPVQYVCSQGHLYYRTRRGGLLDPGPEPMSVAIEIDGTDAVYHFGWNVLLQGSARHFLGDPRLIPAVRPWFQCAQRCLVEVEWRALTGRRIVEL